MGIHVYKKTNIRFLRFVLGIRFSYTSNAKMSDQSLSSVERQKNQNIKGTEKKIDTEEDISSESRSVESVDRAAVDGYNKEIYRQAWNKKLIWISYSVIIFAAFVETFAGDSTSGLSSYATSAFEAHSMISTAAVVYKITAIVSYPFLAKLNDFFGRAEGFGFAVLIYTLSYVLYAACQNVETYICAEMLYAIGRIGYRVFQQVFIADTTSLINRGMLSQLPDALASVPSLYVGSVIQDAIIEHSTWRWGYGIWAMIMAVSCCALTTCMYILDKRAKVTGERKISVILRNLPEGNIFKKILYVLFIRLDLFGAALLLVGLVLVFIPMTLTGTSSPYEWHEARLIAMIVVGGVIFIAFILWNWYVPKYPFVQRNVLTKKTMLLACIIVALDWCTNSSYSQYMKTTLQVAKYVTVGEATRIDDSKKACLQVFGVVGGVCMKYTKRSKIYIIGGIPLYYIGHALLVYFMNTRNNEVADRGLLYMAEVFIGVGRGFYGVALQVIIQAVAGESGIAMSTAFFLCFNSIGSLCGTSIAGGIWNSVVIAKLEKYLPASETAKASKIYASLTTALSYKKGTAERDAIARAYRETQQIIGWTSLGIISPILILMWFIDNVHLTKHIDAYATDSENEVADCEEITDNNKMVDSNEAYNMKNVSDTKLGVKFKSMTRKEKLIWLFGL